MAEVDSYTEKECLDFLKVESVQDAFRISNPTEEQKRVITRLKSLGHDANASNQRIEKVFFEKAKRSRKGCIEYLSLYPEGYYRLEVLSILAGCSKKSFAKKKKVVFGCIIIVLVIIALLFLLLRKSPDTPEPFRESEGVDKEAVDDVVIYGNIRNNPNYQVLTNFSEGLAAVTEEPTPSRYSQNGFGIEGKYSCKYGYVNMNGDIVIPCIYDFDDNYYLGTFKNGIARVVLNGKYGVINSSGEEIIPFKYNMIDITREPIKAYDSKETHYYSLEGDRLDPPTDKRYKSIQEIEVEGHSRVVDVNGNEFLPVDYTNAHIIEDKTNPQLIKVTKGYQYAIYDSNGKMLVAFGKYDDISYYREGLCKVCDCSDGICRYGFIDRNCNEIVPLIYSSAEDFLDGYAFVTYGSEEDKNVYINYVDNQGNELLSHDFVGKSGLIVNGQILVAKKGGNWYLADTKGNTTLVARNKDNAFIFTNSRFVMVMDNYKYGLNNKQGRVILPCKYNKIDFSDDDEIINAQQEDGYWGFIKINGQTVTPFVFDDASRFINGYAWVKLNGKCTIIDKTGKDIFSD